MRAPGLGAGSLPTRPPRLRASESWKDWPVATIRPFRALRPPRDRASRVASPPYDVVSIAEARAMAAGNAESFLRVSLP